MTVRAGVLRMHLSSSHINMGQVHWERVDNDASSNLCPDGPWFYIVFVLKVPIIRGYGILR